MRILWAFLAVWIALPVMAAQPACRAVISYLKPPLSQCHGDARLRIAAVGDVLLHRPLQRRGYADPKGFYAIWEETAPIFRAADIAYANLEGPTATGLARNGAQVTDPGPVFDDRVYTSFPQFNYHTRVIDDLKRAGVNFVSTANNHALDRGPKGADLTIEALTAKGLPFSGTIPAGADRDFAAMIDTRLGRVAWIACSYSTNGLPDPNRQMLMCFEDRAELLAEVARLSRRQDIAALVVSPHWGIEYSHSPNARQKALARDLIHAGATLVMGTHPHVVQPWEEINRGDGTTGLAVYSTGNFVSGQVSLPRRAGALAWIELCRPVPKPDLASAVQARLTVGHTGWVPVVMKRDASGPVLEVVRGAASGLAGQALGLLARHLPENGVKFSYSCDAQSATLTALQ